MKIDVCLAIVQGDDIEKVSPFFFETLLDNSKVKVEVFPEVDKSGLGVLFISSREDTVPEAIRDIIAACPKVLFSNEWRTKMMIQCTVSVLIIKGAKRLNLELSSEDLLLIASIGASLEVDIASQREFEVYKRALR
jgi:hypothetical protein